VVLAIIAGSLFSLEGLFHHQLVSDITNALHYPGGMAIALALWSWWPRSPRATLVLWLLCGVFFAAIEIIQPFFGRNGNVADWLRSMAGVSVVVLFFYCRWENKRMWLRPIVTTAIVLFLVIATPTVKKGVAMQHIKDEFPLLANFETENDDALWAPDRKSLFMRRSHGAMQQQFGMSDQFFGLIRHSDTRWPSAYYYPVVKDWRGYQKLCLESRAEGEGQQVFVRIDDNNTQSWRSAALRDFPNSTQWSSHCIMLTELKTVAGKPLDLSNIQRLKIYAKVSDTARELHLDNMKLVQ